MIEGLRLMAVGMTTVFGFLSIMVVMMYASAWFFQTFDHLFPEPEPIQPRIAPSDDDEIAVVLAAIAAHRSQG